MDRQDLQQLEKLLERNSQTIRGEIRSVADTLGEEIKSTAEKVKKEVTGEITEFLDRAIIPQLEEISGRVEGVRQELKEDIETVKEELREDIGKANRLLTNIEVSLTDKVVLHDQEIKILKKRLTRVETKLGLVA